MIKTEVSETSVHIETDGDVFGLYNELGNVIIGVVRSIQDNLNGKEIEDQAFLFDVVVGTTRKCLFPNIPSNNLIEMLMVNDINTKGDEFNDKH